MNTAPATRSGAWRAELEQVLGAAREARHHGAVGPGLVHHCQAVTGELRGSVALRIAAAIGSAVAEAVHRQHAEMAREVGDLHLPVARMDERPGRDQEQRLLALAVDLVEELLTVTLDEALRVRVDGTALLAVAADGGRRGLRSRRSFRDRGHLTSLLREPSQPSIAESNSS